MCCLQQSRQCLKVENYNYHFSPDQTGVCGKIRFAPNPFPPLILSLESLINKKSAHMLGYNAAYSNLCRFSINPEAIMNPDVSDRFDQ